MHTSNFNSIYVLNRISISCCDSWSKNMFHINMYSISSRGLLQEVWRKRKQKPKREDERARNEERKVDRWGSIREVDESYNHWGRGLVRQRHLWTILWEVGHFRKWWIVRTGLGRSAWKIRSFVRFTANFFYCHYLLPWWPVLSECLSQSCHEKNRIPHANMRVTFIDMICRT